MGNALMIRIFYCEKCGKVVNVLQRYKISVSLYVNPEQKQCYYLCNKCRNELLRWLNENCTQ